MRDLLKERGLKATPARLQLLKVLKDRDCSMTAEELKRHCRDLRIDLVTIYRNLKTFEDKQIVRRSNFGDGVERYEFCGRGHHHHHVVCRKCHDVKKLPDCNLRGLEKLAKDLGFSEVSHSLEMFGVCRRCSL